ncbi:hypothetical protein [Aliarcobacter cryaerophilus]|uniref:hypothetical protein n=1 Tax=Aliarcobacter cryaerophilus TaxID=28198 RepID=UPI00082B0C0F|nr:hypothetical protein [Aliarcobacter cryaerophilus]
METIEENEYLSSLCKEYNIKLPNNLQNRKIYEEIENFREAEYIYCIAYEMLIRTDEYNRLLEEYKPLKNKSKYDMTNEEFLKLRELINKMNQLGLKKTSFLGFDNENDDDHVFKMIEYYDEVTNSPWNVRMLHKFESNSDENIFYELAKFYFEKGELYKCVKGLYYPMPQEAKKLVLDDIKNKSKWKTKEERNEFYDLLESYFIPCIIEESTNEPELKSLASYSIYLKELDKAFLSMIKEKKDNNILIQIKSDITNYNIEFWNKFTVNDIKDGLNKLIEFYVYNNLIYNKNMQHINGSINEILKNPSNYYIPCVNLRVEDISIEWHKQNDIMLNNAFINNLELNGLKSIINNKGSITLKQVGNIYLIQLSKYITLDLLDDSFLKTLEYEDLKNIYINTEPKFSRPRLMFDEARLTNIPINLNLSKEDLLHYISQIKDDYDRDKNIVKTFDEYFFNLALESDLTEIPENIKFANQKRSSDDKKIFPVKRDEFKKRISYAFYIYDIFKFFIPYIKKKRIDNTKKINNEIKQKRTTKDIYKYDNFEYTKDYLITQISYLFKNELSQEQVEYYLTTMKEFIHGINLKGENDVLKKVYNPKVDEKRYPKYKDLIIGNSYIIKSNKKELINKLID